ncbi:hypothetical protein ASZ90_006325 [hydrocarbon metagenome]|uniref:Methyltransferase domain-containing protein n=1 Tax=hydrocarbon metagenome TaxID=938273 RepID=A0A0W8FT11_9ZZZZ
MQDTILKKLVCPVCNTREKSDKQLSIATYAKADESPTLFCNNCQSRFAPIDAILNLAGDVIAPRLFSSQWAMEFEPIVTAYEAIWRPCLTSFVSDLAWEMETSRQLMDVSSGMDVLDLACGTGNFTRIFSEAAKHGTVIGVDLSLPMLKQGRRRIKEQNKTDITLIRVDVTKWPFAPETFDRIHCAGALHLFPDIQNVFNSIYRSLKTEGYFVGATYCLEGNIVINSIQKYLEKAHGIHWFAQQELQKLSSNAGFTRWEHQTYRQGIVFKVQKL